MQTIANDDFNELQVENRPAIAKEIDVEPLEGAELSKHVILHVYSRDEDHPPLRFRMKRTQSLKKLMQTYCNLRNFPFEKSRFYSVETWTAVQDSDTPQSEGMNDDNSIYHVTSFFIGS